MSKYEKPIVLANSELFEGVYAASGEATSNSNDLSASFSITGHDGANTWWFSVTLTNNSSEDITDWSIPLSFNGTVNSASSYSGNASVSGNTVTLTPADYNRTISAGSSVTVSGSVTGTGIA